MKKRVLPLLLCLCLVAALLPASALAEGDYSITPYNNAPYNRNISREDYNEYNTTHAVHFALGNTDGDVLSADVSSVELDDIPLTVGVDYTLEEYSYTGMLSVWITYDCASELSVGTHAITITMTDGSELTSTIVVPDAWILTVESNVEGGGIYFTGGDSSSTGLETYYLTKDNRVNLDADEPEGYVFDHWVIDGETITTEMISNFSTNKDTTISVYFVESEYGLSAEPEELDFGVEDPGYEAPAAQTVTLRNTGNDSYCLEQPTSEYYDIGELYIWSDYFEKYVPLGNAYVLPGEIVTFTVQPKEGLPSGNYTQEIEINAYEYLGGGPVAHAMSLSLANGPEIKGPSEGPELGNGGLLASATVTAKFIVTGESGAPSLCTLSFETNGGSKINDITRSFGTTVDLSDYVPTREGYKFLGWHADEELSGSIDSIQLLGSKTVYAEWSKLGYSDSGSCPSARYVDVNRSLWYHEAIDYVLSTGIMDGTSDSTFEPNSALTRAMLVTILYRLDGSPAVSGGSGFSDVAEGAWYADAVAWASQNGIVDGYGGGLFGPSDPITREQMAAILYRYAGYEGRDVTKSASLGAYSDAGQVSSWALASMKWAVGEGYISGKTASTLDPKGSATRAEVAQLMMNYCEA